MTQFRYSKVVADAGEAAGWDRNEALARWREASAFAHGRTWPLLRLSEAQDGEPIPGGFTMRVTLDEAKLGKVAALTTDILHAAIDSYATLSDAPH